jgi:adenylosuccinate synthase
MPATIVVGGQYGSEGKGKVVALLACREESPWLVRCGGPNSGHTVTIGDTDIVLRQVPSCTIPNRAMFCIGAGAVVDEDVLLRELDLLAVDQERIVVDPRAVIVTEEDRQAEQHALGAIASTLSGTGAALMRRMLRQEPTLLAGHSTALRHRCRVETVAPLLHQALDNGDQVIVEGTQGFGLSLLHGTQYPYVTSRDTTAAGFAMEVGLSPRLIDKIVMVVRTFPIRVGGPSGPLANEISWDDVRVDSAAPETIAEYTSVTRRLRRVARFDLELVRVACQYNRPTSLAVMGLDRLDYRNTRVTDLDLLTTKARQFLDEVAVATGVPIEFIGTGFGTLDAIRVSVATRPPVGTHG